MKKSLLMLGVAVAALASCTQNEVVDIAESNVIKFDNAFVGKATKAVTSPELTTANIEDMYVFAFDGNGDKVFTNQPENVYRTAENAWGYTNLVPWDDAKSYEFRAYAGKDLESAVKYDNDNDALKFTDIVVDGAEGNQFDLLYSNWVNRTNTTGSAVDDKNPIAFTFEHLLSMVKFTLKSGFGESTQVAIKDFKFYGLKTKGDYNADGTSETWVLKEAANTGDNTNFKGNEEADGDIAYFTKDKVQHVENSWVIIPQTNNESDENAVEMVKFTVNLIDDEIAPEDKVKDFIVKLPKIEWQKGYRYNYIFTITPKNMEIADKYITFNQPEVEEWKDGELTVNGETNSTEGVEIGH